MKFKRLPDDFILKRLEPPALGRKVRMVLDTDTYNEIDDQFAVTYSILASERLNVEAIYAAPFENEKSDNYGDGMEKSYEEILRVISRLDVKPDNFVYKGSKERISDQNTPVPSSAAEDLVTRAMKMDKDPLYVLAIGALTNISSAIIMEPEIREKIVLIWLGGQPTHWNTANEFNLQGDLKASQAIFDCGVPMLYFPCTGVTSHLLTTEAEMREYVKGKGAIGDYLYKIYIEHTGSPFAGSKVI